MAHGSWQMLNTNIEMLNSSSLRSSGSSDQQPATSIEPPVSGFIFSASLLTACGCSAMSHQLWTKKKAVDRYDPWPLETKRPRTVQDRPWPVIYGLAPTLTTTKPSLFFWLSLS